MITRFMACPPPQLKLHATTPTPQQPEKGSSPEQRRIGGGAQRQSGQTAPNLDENSRAHFLSCTSMPRALEAQRRSLPMMSSDRKSSHWQWVGVTHVICNGRQRSGPMITKPGVKGPQRLGISYTEGIAKWQTGMAASRWRLTSTLGKNWQKGGRFGRGVLL
jgi:hypothetical protein